MKLKGSRGNQRLKVSFDLDLTDAQVLELLKFAVATRAINARSAQRISPRNYLAELERELNGRITITEKT